MTNTTANRNLGEELITNGDFETYATTRKMNKKGWDQYEEIDGWTSSMDKIEIQTRDFQTGNTKGNAVVELDAVKNATIDTNVNVTDAGTYQFSVDYAMRGTNADTNGFEVLVDGVVVATVNPTEKGWNTLELSLELDAGAHEIQLRGIGEADCIGTVIDNVSLRQDLDAQPPFVVCDHPDAVLIDFEGLAAGETVSDQYEGVSIVSFREQDLKGRQDGDNHGMVFDGANPTGGDTDLTASGDNVLIISEDDDASDPDDNAQGGRMWFMFDEPAHIHDLKVLDAEEGGRIGLVTTDQGTVWVNIPGGTDGGIQQIMIDVENVVKLDVILNGSGAIDDICYVPGQPAPLGSIAGTYFMDNNDNDIQDAADMGLEGQTVWLVKPGTGVVAKTTTDANGDYIFEGLDAGDYYVRFDGNNVGDKVLVNSNAGNDDTVDSDIKFTGSAGNHNTATISLAQGENVTDVDAGVEELPLGSIAGTYFCDENDNDVLDAGDATLAGQTVWLLQQGTRGPIAKTKTDENGNYIFEGLDAGNYRVRFDGNNVGDKEFVSANVGGDDTIDSDVTIVGGAGNGNTAWFSLAQGEDKTDVDAGVEAPAPIPGSLSGRYFMDTDGNDQDDNEMGIAGVVVTLVETGATTTTAADGSYSFGDLAPGDYTVEFSDPNGALDGKQLVDANVGPDATDSDAIGDTTLSTISGITVTEGNDTPDNDAGAEVPNTAPEAEADTAKTCADTAIVVDVLTNDGDADGDILSVLSIADADELAFVGESLTLDSGAVVTLNADGTVSYDGTSAHEDLLVGQMVQEETITYTVSDGNDGTGSATLDITACGTASTLEMICASLPDQVELTIAFDGVNFLIDVTDDASTTADDALASATWNGACIDIEGQLILDQELTVNVYCTDIPEGMIEHPENLDLINWIINQEFVGQDTMDGSAQYNIFDVQEAVWVLSDGTATNNAVANEIVAKAEASGEGYVSGEGDLVAVVFDPIAPDASVTDTQTFIMGVEWDALALDCIC